MSDPWGRGRNSCTDQVNQPARPAAFHVLKVLPGSGSTIQSFTGGFFFTGGWKQKGSRVKRRPKSPCHRSWVIPVCQPGELQSIPALQFRSQLHCQTIVWLQGQPWCGLKPLLGTLSPAGPAEAGSGVSKGNHICCVPSCMFLPNLVGTCFCFM